MADGANFESLNFEISVNTKEAAQGVRLLRNAVDGLAASLRAIEKLNVHTLFAGISSSAKQAAAEVKIQEEEIRRALDKLAAEANMKDRVDYAMGMQNTFWSFEQQTKLHDALESARDWQTQMVAAYQSVQTAQQAFYDNPVNAADERMPFPTPNVASAQAAIRQALSSFHQVTEATEKVGEEAGEKFWDGFARSAASGKNLKTISFGGKIDKEFESIRSRNEAINDAARERFQSRLQDDVSYWAQQSIQGGLGGRNIPSGAGLVEWLRKSQREVADAGRELGHIAAEAVREQMRADFGMGMGETLNFGAAQGWQQAIIGSIHGNAFWGTDAEIAAERQDKILTSLISQTGAYASVSKVVNSVTKAFTPAMEAAGVSASAFKDTMTALIAPISGVTLAIQVAVKVATFLVDQFNEFNAAMKKVVDTAKAINEKFNPFVALKKELESLLALAKRQIMRRAINAVIKSITEGLRSGIENLAEYDEQFSATMESFRNAMGLFKNSIGVAVAPIISYFIPAINALLSALTRAMNTLARLTALLTGQHTYTIAKDYQEIGESAGGASGKVKELQRTILGFDEINKLNGQNGSGSGGGSGAGDSINSYLTEEVGDWPYDSWGEAFLAFVDWLDRTGVPALQTGLDKVADVVNTFSTNLADMFSYEGVQEAISQLGEDIGEAINNFFTGDPADGGLNWQEMGRAFGQTIKSIFNFAASFLTPLNFFEFGQKIAEFVASAFEQITPEDIQNMAYTLSTPLRAVIGMALGFLTSAPLPDIMEKVGQFVNGLIEAIGKAIGGGTGEKGGKWQSNMQIAANNIANGLASFLATVNWPALFNTLTTLVSGIISGLETILNRLMKDKEFVNAVHQFVDFIINTAVKWFMLKVKAVTGLAGNMSLGRMLGAALFGGTDTSVPDATFSLPGLGIQDIFSALINGSEEATDAVDDLNSAVGKGAPTINQYGKTMRDNMSSVTTAAVNANNAVRDNTIGVSGVTAHLSKMATDSGKPTTDTGNAIKGVGKASKDAADEVKKQTIGQTGSVTAFLKTMKVDGSDYADKLGTNIQSKLSTAATKAAENAGAIKKSVVDAVGGAKTAVAQQNWNSVGGEIKAGINSGMTIFQGDLKGWANQFKAEIKREFNIKSPSRWARDEVGGNIGEGIALGLTDSMSSVEDACSGLREGIAGEFSGMSVLDMVGANASKARGANIASSLGDYITSAMLSAQSSSDNQNIVCEVYLDRDKIAEAVTRGQQANNRRYSPTAMSY